MLIVWVGISPVIRISYQRGALWQPSTRSRWAATFAIQLSSQPQVTPPTYWLKPLFHSSQKPACKLAASAFKYCDWMKVLAASLRVGFCDEWKRAFTLVNLEQNIVSSIQTGVEARVVGIGDSEAAPKQRNDERQEQQFMKDGCMCVFVIIIWAIYFSFDCPAVRKSKVPL